MGTIEKSTTTCSNHRRSKTEVVRVMRAGWQRWQDKRDAELFARVERNLAAFEAERARAQREAAREAEVAENCQQHSGAPSS